MNAGFGISWETYNHHNNNNKIVIIKLGVAVNIYNFNICKVETGGLGIQGHPLPEYMRLYLKNPNY